MKITKLIVDNFKSFHKIELSEEVQRLGNVNILVGTNASGKSNFIYVFEFLKEIKKSGIEKTMKEKFGGFSKLKNFNTDKRNFSIEIELSDTHKQEIKEVNAQKRIFLLRNKIAYKIELREVSKKFDLQEKITFHEQYILEDLERQETIDLSSEHLYGVENIYGKFQAFSNQKEIQFYKQDEIEIQISSPYPDNFISNLNERYQNKSILEYEGVFIPADIFDFGIFDFEPKYAKGARIDMNTEVLDKNGGNLSLVIKEILAREEDKAQFIADIKYILDFVENIEIESFGNLIDLKVKEKNNKTSTESLLLSDGTISIMAMVVALYYQKNNILLIEEPERCIHPSLIDILVERFYEVTEEHESFYNKQVFITTHSPEVLKHLQNKEDLYILLRNENNHSTISKPIEKERVQAFLENELGLDTLFIDNLLNK